MVDHQREEYGINLSKKISAHFCVTRFAVAEYGFKIFLIWSTIFVSDGRTPRYYVYGQTIDYIFPNISMVKLLSVGQYLSVVVLASQQ